MKAKKLIEDLQKLVDKNGDLDVIYTSSFTEHICGPNEYCYCSEKTHEFSIYGISKYTFPKNGKMEVVKISLDGLKI